MNLEICDFEGFVLRATANRSQFFFSLFSFFVHLEINLVEPRVKMKKKEKKGISWFRFFKAECGESTVFLKDLRKKMVLGGCREVTLLTLDEREICLWLWWLL